MSADKEIQLLSWAGPMNVKYLICLPNTEIRLWHKKQVSKWTIGTRINSSLCNNSDPIAAWPSLSLYLNSFRGKSSWIIYGQVHNRPILVDNISHMCNLAKRQIVYYTKTVKHTSVPKLPTLCLWWETFYGKYIWSDYWQLHVLKNQYKDGLHNNVRHI